MNLRGRRAEKIAKGGYVIGVARQNIAAEPECHENEMRIDYIRPTGDSEQPTDRGPVVQGVHGYRLEERCQPRLASTIPPDLSNDRLCGVDRNSRTGIGA